MLNPLTWLSRKRFRYEPLITVEISREKLLHNLGEFKRISQKSAIAPVLKSNAYGHGLKETAKVLDRAGAAFFIVDSYFEALALHSYGISTPVLVIGYTRPETIMQSRPRNASYAVTSLDNLRRIESTERYVKIHLKIDTGMHRQGIALNEVESAIELIDNNPYIILEGICSHLCDADNKDPSFTEGQINVWNKIVRRFREHYPKLKFWHLSATEGFRFRNDISANVSRLGLGLYGLADVNSFRPKLDLKPVLALRTIISGIRKVRRDETLGYSNSFRADRDMIVATIPIGYYEGVDRRLSNRGYVLAGHAKAPCRIVGRVSMNITTIDITNINGLKVGDPVTVIDSSNNQRNSLAEISKACNTIPYDIAVRIPGQLKRTVV